MKCSKITEQHIDACINTMTELCDKRFFSRTLDITVGILRHFEDCWSDLPDSVKRAFVMQYGEEAIKDYEKQNNCKTRDA
jgi:hypothetical protein